MKHIPASILVTSVAAVLMFASTSQATDPLVIACRKTVPQVRFAAERIATALGRSKSKCAAVELRESPGRADIVLISSAEDAKRAKALLGKLSIDAAIKPQGFRIARGAGKTLCVVACDAAGAMYVDKDIKIAER